MLLELTDVHFGYRRTAPVLRGVGVGIPPGRLTAIIGPNGAGKSTLLRLMLGVLTPASGHVRLDTGTGPAPLSSFSPRRRAPHLAYVPQRSAPAEPFTVEQIVRLGRLARPADAGAVDGAIDAMSIADLRHELYGALSAGQQQRVVLARALAQLAGGDVDPARQAILADEPCAAMDPRHVVRTMEVLRTQAAAGRAVVVVLHDLTTALRYADDAVLLDESGTVAGSGAATEVLSPERLEGVFGIGFRRLGSADAPGLGALVPAGDSR